MPNYNRAYDNNEEYFDDSDRVSSIRQDALITQRLTADNLDSLTADRDKVKIAHTTILGRAIHPLRKYLSRLVTALSNALYRVKAALFPSAKKSPENNVTTRFVEQREDDPANYTSRSRYTAANTNAELIDPPVEIAALLSPSGLNTKENLAFIENHPQSERLTEVLGKLLAAYIPLEQSDFDGLIEYPHLSKLFQVLVEIQPINNIVGRKSILRGIFAFEQATSISFLAEILAKLPESLIKTNLYEKLLPGFGADEGKLDNLNALLTILQDAELTPHLSQDDFDALIEKSKSYYYSFNHSYDPHHYNSMRAIIEELNSLEDNNNPLPELKLTQENFNQLMEMEYKKLENLSLIVKKLNSAQLLTQENFDQLLNLGDNLPDDGTHNIIQSKFYNLNLIVEKLSRVVLLTQENFDKLLSLGDDLVSATQAISTVLSDIPDHLWTPVVFNQLIEHSQQQNPLPILQGYVFDLLNEDNPAEEFERAQSTHTASVHQSVSESAQRLAKRYQAKIKNTAALDETIDQIEKYLSSLVKKSPTNINQAAQRALVSLKTKSFTDPTSQLSLKELLVLSFSAINDDEQRIGTRGDALGQFVQGLYEIQRGYNLSESGIDKKPKEPDLPICLPGAFNKLLEKLQTIHPDVEIRFITKDLAAKKLPTLVNELANDYLSHLANNAKTAKDFLGFTHLMDNLKKEGVELIFNAIKDKVTECIWDEFKTVYPDKSAPDFIEFIESGIYTELKQLKDFQPLLTNSIAYRDFCSQMLYSPRLFSAAKTQASATEQEHPFSHTESNCNKSPKNLSII